MVKMRYFSYFLFTACFLAISSLARVVKDRKTQKYLQSKSFGDWIFISITYTIKRDSRSFSESYMKKRSKKQNKCHLLLKGAGIFYKGDLVP